LNQTIKEGNIKPDETIIAGNFLRLAGGLDEILVLEKSGKLKLYTFCPGEKKFIKIPVTISSGSSPFLSARNFWKGRFIREPGDQVLIVGEKEWVLGKFETSEDPCHQGENPVADFRILWRSLTQNLKGDPLNDVNTLHAGDFDGDQITELLITESDGSWRIIRLSNGTGGSFTTVAEGSQVLSWDRNNGPFAITPGRFVNRLKLDVILTVFINKETGKPDYSLSRFNPGRASFEPLLMSSDHNLGKTVGFDSLQVSDQFFTGNFEGSGKNAIFRYSRERRFDLKQIQFNDTTFEILRNIDFQGYPKDHNPKYYEVLRMIPGHFTEPSVTSILVIGRNCMESIAGREKRREYHNKPVLPDFISIYSLNRPLKK
jgi:hypothetical protein